MDIFSAITLFFEGVAGLLAIALFFNIWRGIQSGDSWIRTCARIKTFGLNQGVASVVYEYSVDGTLHIGKAIVPGPFFSKKVGQVTAPKAAYLNPDGSLKFPPNADVDVWYNPRNPEDAALVTGIPRGVWKGVVLALCCASFPLVISTYKDWASKHIMELMGGGFLLAGVFLFCYGISLFRQSLKTQNYPFVNGRLLKAEVVYSSSGENGGFAPSVKFEYSVDGKVYQSQQYSSGSVQVLTTREKVQAKIDQLRNASSLSVYYNPRVPWESFLYPASYGTILIPVIMGLSFAAFGLLALFSKH